MQKKKICIVAPGHWSDIMGGAQYQTLLLIRALAATGNYEVTYIAKHTKPGYRATDHDIVQVSNPWNRTRGLFLDAFPVYRALEQVAPDVIYHRGSTAYSGIVAQYVRKTATRSIWHIASDADVTPFRLQLTRDLPLRFLDKKFFEYGLRYTNLIVAQTADQAHLLKKNYGLCATAIVRNFHPMPDEAICKASPVEVLWIGNIKSLKQPERFIRAAAELRGLTDARFIMIGAMQGSSRWQRRIRREINATANLSYRGACTQQEVNEALARAAVLVNTSLWEGFSNTFIQAWMRRVPVVSLNVDPDGVLSVSNLGLRSGSPQQLRADILRLINDDALRGEMGARAQRYAMEQHSLANIGTLIELIDGAQAAS